jgi:hypothetical protein
MTTPEQNLTNFENKAFYRFVKVIYCFLFGLTCIVGALFMIYASFIWGAIFIGALYALFNILRDTAYYIAYGKRFSFDWLRFKKNKSIDENTKNKKLYTPKELAGQVILLLVHRDTPFDKTSCTPTGKDIVILEKLENVVYIASMAYSLHIYLLLISVNFGSNVAHQVKKHLLWFLEKLTSDKDPAHEGTRIVIESVKRAFTLIGYFIDEDKTYEDKTEMLTKDGHEYKIGISFLINFPLSPYFVDFDDESRKSQKTYEEMESLCEEHSSLMIFSSLTKVKRESYKIFWPFLEDAGLNLDKEIIWSENPGCFEKHLQRKSDNPLFYPENKRITQTLVDSAREKDIADRNELHTQFQDFLKRPIYTTVNENIEHRKLIDDLIKRAFENGGDCLSILPALHDLREKNINDLKNAFLHDDDMSQIIKDANENHSENVAEKYHNEFCLQVIRPDTPIKPSELIPSVLSEDIETMKAFFRVLPDQESLAHFKKHGLTIIRKLIKKNQGADISFLEEKIALLEH